MRDKEMTQEEINDLLERPQPTCASMLDIPRCESPHLAAIADALEHAKAEHPKFAQRLFLFYSVLSRDPFFCDILIHNDLSPSHR